jgi:nitronate monooxygenase
MANPVCNSLKIELPIVQAAMGGASCPELAAAVSNAGGLGMLALSWSSADDMRREIRKTRGLTVRPFGVNLVLEWPQEDRLALCLEEGVPIVSFFWGQAGPLTEVAHRGGAKVLHTIASADAARRAVDDGADILVAQGWEAGGHVHGKVATMALVPAVVDRVSETPVIAAGGIADGRGLAAAMALGASGAWIGTRFLASPEAAIHPRYRDLLLAAKETDTEYAALFDVHWSDAPHRTLRNATFDEWQKAGRPVRGQRPGEGDIVAKSPAGASVLRYESYTPRVGTDGDIDALSLWAGQGVGLVHRIQPASEIVREIAAEAQATLSRLASAAKFLS